MRCPLRCVVFPCVVTLWFVMGPAVLGGAARSPELTVYPPPDGLAASPKYEIRLFDGSTWVDTYVNFDEARTSGRGSQDEPGKTFSWTTFEATGATLVRVRRMDGAFDKAVIRPLRYKIEPDRVDANTIEFTITPGQKVSVEFDTEIKNRCCDGTYGIPCVKNILMVFADAKRHASALEGVPQSDIYRVESGCHEVLMRVEGTGQQAGKCTIDAAGKSVVVFGPGVHDIGYWQVPNSIEQIHFEGGAVVFGSIDVMPEGREPFYDRKTIYHVYRNAWREESLRPTFKITGPGILSGAKLPWHLRKDFTLYRRTTIGRRTSSLCNSPCRKGHLSGRDARQLPSLDTGLPPRRRRSHERRV